MLTKLLAEHDHDEGDGDESQEVGFEFFIAGSDSAELLEFVKKALDLVALLVAFLVVTTISKRLDLGGMTGVMPLASSLARMALLS
ncbi:MAG: hypothetical protein WBQ05_03550 [Candidatus Competibacter denitrificans]